jgi:hypothetical protein
VPRLFALDQGFPLPIVNVLRGYQADADLVSLGEIDSRLPELEDWQVLLALHHDRRAWDGLITTDSSMLNQATELSALAQTKLTLVAAMGAGHDPVKASGLLFAYLSRICKLTRKDVGQIWQLRAGNILPSDPIDALVRLADHRNVGADQLISDSRLDDETFARDPLLPETLDY